MVILEERREARDEGPATLHQGRPRLASQRPPLVTSGGHFPVQRQSMRGIADQRRTRCLPMHRETSQIRQGADRVSAPGPSRAREGPGLHRLQAIVDKINYGKGAERHRGWAPGRRGSAEF
jgi:hypothetical protein